ncbi:hypothetical protein KAR34_07820 [bacterium]|nr:hypothetical protein [bacterium]
MLIVSNPISLSELQQMANDMFGDMVKAVVDIERGLLAVDAELHADLEALLIENGSESAHLWGINLYPDLFCTDFVEFDSLINMKPSQGNRSRSVENKDIQSKILTIVSEQVKS